METIKEDNLTKVIKAREKNGLKPLEFGRDKKDIKSFDNETGKPITYKK